MRERVKRIIVAFTGHENIIAVPRVLVEMTKDWSVAAMLNQLLYWSAQKEWIYKSVSDWNEEVGAITRYKVNKLIALPFIETKLKKANGAPTTHYRINWEAFERQLIEILNRFAEKDNSDLLNSTNPFADKDNSLTETTSETTIKKKNIPEPTYIKVGDEFKKSKINFHSKMVGILAKVTKMDFNISMNAGRLNRASKQLRDAGYSIKDIERYGVLWKEDWRYKQDKKPPLLSVLLTEIGQMKFPKDSAEDRKKKALAEIERAEK